MGFSDRIANTLIRPKEAMESISKDPFIEEGVMIVGVYALFSAMAAYVQSTKMVIITEGVSPNPELAGIIGVLSAIIFAFITWFVLVSIIHTISLALGGKGIFYPHMMVLIGFAMLPLIFSSIISAVLISTAETSTVTISLGDPSASENIIRGIQSSMPYLASTIINSITWAWCLGIIYIGLQSCQKLSKGKASAVVAIPLALMLIITYGLR